MTYESSKEEEKYFQVREKDRRDEMRRRLDAAAAEAKERRAMADELRTSDDALIERLRSLHFDSDTARVLDVLPLVHVAWADDTVTEEERATVLELLDARGIARSSQAFLLIESLLETRPSSAFLEETLDLLRQLIGEDVAKAITVVDLSVRVAEASQGLFGLGPRVNTGERKTIQSIADGLGPAAQKRFEQALRRA